MSSDSLRASSRRENTRRKDERRVIDFIFGSKEWLEMIQEHYFLWPKKDQRMSARRSQERRELERRRKDMGRDLLSKQLEKTVERLTEEEMQVLNGLWTN